MTRTGCAAMRQKITPWMLVEIISSDTPIIFSVLSAWKLDRTQINNKIECVELKRKENYLNLGALSYPEALQKWWPETRRQSRWRWRQRGPEGSEHQCSHWGSDGIGALGPSPSHRRGSLCGPVGPPAAPLGVSQLGRKINKNKISARKMRSLKT